MPNHFYTYITPVFRLVRTDTLHSASDSDTQLTQSDSDTQLTQSDSDTQLTQSDSDTQLTHSDSDTQLIQSDSDTQSIIKVYNNYVSCKIVFTVYVKEKRVHYVQLNWYYNVAHNLRTVSVKSVI